MLNFPVLFTGFWIEWNWTSMNLQIVSLPVSDEDQEDEKQV